MGLLGDVGRKAAKRLKGLLDIEGEAEGLLGDIPSDQIASKSAFLYNPPAKPQRAFELDYPQGAITDDAGNLLYDIDGRPFGRGLVVGRKVAGGADQALPAAEFDAITEAATGQKPARVAPSKIGQGGYGAVGINRYSGQPEQVYLSTKLSPQQLPQVYAHEVGHVVDQAAGEIPTAGLEKELSFIYNDINNPVLAQRRGLLGDDVDISTARNLRNWTPNSAGYKTPVDIQREQMAEAIRSYLADPNYIKTVASNTAARIREYVNSNPRLKDIIQFNTLAPASAALALATHDQNANAAPTTGEAVPDEYPGLEGLADFIDKYVRTPVPLMEEPLSGVSNYLRNFGRERPALQRYLDALGATSDFY